MRSFVYPSCPVIVGKDAGVLVLQSQSGAVGVWDANRYNECSDNDPRYTFGEFLVEGNGGTIRLYLDARITVQRLGQRETEHAYHHERRDFSGDCVYTTQRHFVDCMLADRLFETNGDDPGVPVWRCGPDSRFPGLPLVVFPGNVGSDESLVEVLRIS